MNCRGLERDFYVEHRQNFDQRVEPDGTLSMFQIEDHGLPNASELGQLGLR